MRVIAATEAKSRFGQVLSQAQRAPIVIQSHGRNAAVIMDYEEYERLQALEDALWGSRADEALKSGLLSPEDTMSRLTAGLAKAERDDESR